MEHLTKWSEFVGLSASIIVAGIYLTKYADILSEKLGLGHIFIGVVFLGWVTSLPEAVITLSSLIRVGQPNLGIGNIYGSCIFNLLMICLTDVFVFKGRVFVKATPHIVLCGALSAITLLVSLLGFFLSNRYGAAYQRYFDPLGVNIGVTSFAILITYVIVTYTLYRAERTGRVPEIDAVSPNRYEDLSLAGVVLKSGIAASVIVVAGIFITDVAEDISCMYALRRSFVGTAFLAAISSMPELVTTLAAARMGFTNMAFANIFGSNIFNIGILAVTDVFYRGGLLFSEPERTSSSHLFVGLLPLLVTMIMIAAIHYRYKPKGRLNPVILLCILLYISALVASYLIG